MFFIRILREYERGIVFRLGRLLPQKGPGVVFLIPIVDRIVKVDLRTITLNIPPQEVITKDNVPVRVNAVAYFKIVDPVSAIVQVETQAITQTRPQKTQIYVQAGAFANARKDAAVRELSQKSVAVLKDLGPKIQWLHSYVTGNKVYCVYLAPDEATVQEHAKRVGLACNRVSAVRRLIDPSTAE